MAGERHGDGARDGSDSIEVQPRANDEPDGHESATSKKSMSCMPNSAEIPAKKYTVKVDGAQGEAASANGVFYHSGEADNAMRFAHDDADSDWTIHRVAGTMDADHRKTGAMWVIGLSYNKHDMSYVSRDLYKNTDGHASRLLPPETGWTRNDSAARTHTRPTRLLSTLKVEVREPSEVYENCVKGTAFYQNYVKIHHKSFEQIAFVCWIRKSWLHLIWINLMLTIFVISCYAFTGGSWVYPCEGDGCTNWFVQVDKIWTCGPFVHCRNGDCQWYDDFVPPYPTWQFAGVCFVIALVLIPIGLLLALADLLYQVMINNSYLESVPTIHMVGIRKLWHQFMLDWAQRLGRDATIISCFSLFVGLLAFGGGFGNTGDKSPPVYPCGICGEKSGPFSLDNCTGGGDSMGGLGAFVCLSVAAMASYVVRDRRVWEDSARKLMLDEDEERKRRVERHPEDERRAEETQSAAASMEHGQQLSPNPQMHQHTRTQYASTYEPQSPRRSTGKPQTFRTPAGTQYPVPQSSSPNTIQRSLSPIPAERMHSRQKTPSPDLFPRGPPSRSMVSSSSLASPGPMMRGSVKRVYHEDTAV
jgi:hypothetical protein